MKVDRTLAARLTPGVPAGIATIGVKGDRAEELVLGLTRLKTKSLKLNQVHYGVFRIPQPSDESRIAEETVVVCRTQVDLVELHCHGGVAVSSAILRAVESAGAVIAEADEFMLCLSTNVGEANIMSQLVRAKTDQVASHLVDQLSGSFIREIQNLLQRAEKLTRLHERDELDSLCKDIRRALDLGERFAAKWTHGWSIVLAGPPNVGKSSLMNRIVGQQKSIVHHEAGTTRDWVEAQTVIEGWPVRLSDTAGVRDASEEIEVSGVKRSIAQIEQADLLVLVVDSTDGWTETHTRLRELAPCPTIVCWNKIDLNPQRPDMETDSPIVLMSCLSEVDESSGTKPGKAESNPSDARLSELLECIAEQLFNDPPDEGAAIPVSSGQLDLLNHAWACVEGGDYSKASEHLRVLLSSELCPPV
ncbi:MAG: GTPase [Pirellulaceae bacterium]